MTYIVGYGQHHGARGSASALQRLRMEGRVVTGGLGHIYGDRSDRGVALLGLDPIGVSQLLGRALIVLGSDKALALDPHRQIEQSP